MDNLNDIKTIHLIGICGTGMGTLAAMLQEAGYQVQGSDENVYPPMSTFLTSRGILITDGYRAENLKPSPDLVVVGNVIRRDNPEAVATLESGLSYCSMPQALHRFFLHSSQSVVVAGTTARLAPHRGRNGPRLPRGGIVGQFPPELSPWQGDLLCGRG